VKSVAVRPLLVVLAGMLVLHLAVANRYGWQRDELYYAVAGRHLQGGYVEFPPLTALLSALARVVFGWSLVGFRLFAFVAGMATAFLAALVARELGGGTRAQVLAAAAVGLSPILLATNGLFQPVSFDQTATMLVLWLAVRLALGRGSWPALGVAVGIGLETKYTLAVVLVLLVAAFAVWRRDALELRGLATAVPVAAVLMVPNLVWEAGHAWISVHWFLHPPASATDESRPEYLLDVFLNTHPLVFAVAVTGVVVLWRDRRLRPLAAVVAATVLAYFVLGG
jgi:4-amino-4-deoxy-L-arabinose transferase-like glycosyltransferase